MNTYQFYLEMALEINRKFVIVKMENDRKIYYTISKRLKKLHPSGKELVEGIIALLHIGDFKVTKTAVVQFLFTASLFKLPSITYT